MQANLLELRNVTKRFPGVLALYRVCLRVQAGETHVVMGENGAGKSTLMKIVDGIYHPDEGEILLGGEEVRIHSPIEAMELGIAMIHQELNTVLDMTVAENLFLGRELGRGLLYSRRQMREKAREVLDQLGASISPDSKMRRLSVAQRQMVEIAKAISLNARIMIMDEPTSAISDKEVEALFKMIRMLNEKGTGIIYISHKMEEIYRIAHRITVMRDGETVGTYKTEDLTRNQLISLMVGREISNIYPEKTAFSSQDEILRAEGLSCGRHFSGVDLRLRRGEVLGLAGLMGAGRSELVETLFGLRRASQGRVWLEGKEVHIRNPKDAIRSKMALVTEDRKQTGLNLKTSVKKDMSILTLGQFCRWRQLVRTGLENAAVDEEIRRLQIKTTGRNQNISLLSGGNQQKVILARWLMAQPDILIMDEPTRGIDVGAKYEIYSIIRELAAKGKAILVVSSEMPEIIGICDRVVVMHEGRVTGELQGEEMTQEAIMELAAGMEEEDESKN